MDDSPSEAMNFSNGIAVEEEETDNSIAQPMRKLSNGIAVEEEETHNRIAQLLRRFNDGIAVEEEETDNSIAQPMRKLINEEKSSENSSFLETLSWQKKVKNLVPSDGFFFPHMDLKKYSKTCEAPVHSRTCVFEETISCFKERDLRYTLPSPTQYKPFIRRKVRQEEIAFDRECKKLEKVWTNRGLPVDRESLCSAASKDAFDLRDLSESLPSTSSSEKKPSVIDFRGLSRRPRSYSWQIRRHIDRFETFAIDSASSCTPREKRRAAERLPTSEIIPSLCNSLKESVMKDAMLRHSLLRAQRWSRLKRIHSEVPPSELEKKPDCGEQIETSEDRRKSDMEEAPQSLALKGQETIRHPSVCPEFAEMSLGGKQEEKRKERQNSDAEHDKESVGLAPLPKLLQDMGQCSSWDSERTWITDFEFPDVRVPLNSPIKKEGNADKPYLFLTMEEALAEIRQKSMRLMRANSKLRTLNSHRGVLSGDMDESLSEKPSSEQVSRPSIQNPRKEAEDLCLSNVKRCRQMIMHFKESVKTLRSFQSCFLLGSLKSDKVVPD